MPWLKQATGASKNKNMNQQIVFIRHAQSVANAGGRTENIESIILTPLGEEQARGVVDRMPFVPDLVVCSPYIRTSLTAAPLIQAHGISNVEIWDEVKEFTYLDRVKYANTNQWERRVPCDQYWERCDPDWRDANGSESFNDLLFRIQKTLIRLKERPEQRIAVFTHGQWLLGLRLWMLYGNDPQLMEKFWPEHCQFKISNTQIFTMKDLVLEKNI